jgi:hypothetical protein
MHYQAQMVLPEALEIASKVNECLGYSYRAIPDIASGFDNT